MPTAPRVRPFRPEDLAALLPLVGRLASFGPPPWREAAEMTRTVEAQFRRLAAEGLPPGHALLLAESADGGVLGFVYLEVQRDFFTQRPHGHVSDVAVAAEAEGTGVGRALMAAAEAWARQSGFDRLTLNVFALNARARAFYGRLGYGEDTVRMVKLLEG
jgi:GNAT superfamily N-acetyltransferase